VDAERGKSQKQSTPEKAEKPAERRSLPFQSGSNSVEAVSGRDERRSAAPSPYSQFFPPFSSERSVDDTDFPSYRRVDLAQPFRGLLGESTVEIHFLKAI
jgi:hypothetical protein